MCGGRLGRLVGGAGPLTPPGVSGVKSTMSASSFAELKRGIPQDLSSSPKLDKYKIARQLAEKAIKVNAFWGSVGRRRLIKTETEFGIWGVSPEL